MAPHRYRRRGTESSINEKPDCGRPSPCGEIPSGRESRTTQLQWDTPAATQTSNKRTRNGTDSRSPSTRRETLSQLEETKSKRNAVDGGKRTLRSEEKMSMGSRRKRQRELPPCEAEAKKKYPDSAVTKTACGSDSNKGSGNCSGIDDDSIGVVRNHESEGVADPIGGQHHDVHNSPTSNILRKHFYSAPCLEDLAISV